jgi:YD repeat-containing protein
VLLVVVVSFLVIAGSRFGISLHLDRDTLRSDAPTLEQRAHPSDGVLSLLRGNDAAAPKLDGQFPCVFAIVTDTEVRPQVGKCGLPADRSGPVERFEADLRYGAFILRQSDLYLSDVFNVPLTRTYNSRDYVHSNPVHAFGKNTNHPYDIAPLGTRFPYTYQIIDLEDGNFVYFPRVSKGTGFGDAVFQHTETSTSFYKAVTAWNGNGWTTWRTDGLTILFPESYNAKSAAQGAPVGMLDAQGNVLRLMRDTSRNLQEILTPNNRWIKFNYDGQSRIIHAEDDQGHSAAYRYNSNGMLPDAVLSSGHARHYAYDGALMTTVTDQNGKVLLRNFYRSAFLVRQDFGGGQAYAYEYTDGATGGPYAETAEVTASDGRIVTVETGDSVPELVKNQWKLPAPPAPKSPVDGPSLEVTMKFVEDQLNRVGPVKFVTVTRDGNTREEWTNRHMEEDSNVNADPASCIVNFHFKRMLGDKVTQDKHAWIPLKAVDNITVLAGAQEMNEWDSAHGHPSWTSRVVPWLYTIKVTGFNSNDNSSFVLLNEDLANRLAKAMVHAVELCGGGNKGRS